jgi:outer membrane protein assembly factor BamB
MGRWGVIVALSALVAATGLIGVVPLSAAVAGSAGVGSASLDWPQFLGGPQHGSVSNATAFTPLNAASAAQVWHWQPPVISGEPAPVLDASPTVVAGTVYIGAQSGAFYALNESTGAVMWSRQLDTRPNVTCRPLGITSTAAVLPDPVTGTSTVYVSGARFLYALDATTGAVIWKAEIGPPDASAPDAYYNWSSPTVTGGHIYMGLASGCDNPLIRGGVEELDQHTGTVLHTWYSVPAGSVGGSVWSSVAVSPTGSDAWVSTGNECDPTVDTCPAGNKIGHSLSIVHLSGSLKFLQAWQVPGAAGHGHDWDFGSSPTLFASPAVPSEVGACNKNGNYYALAAKPLGSTPLWADMIGAPATGGPTAPRSATVSGGDCIASAVWDAPAGVLFIGGNATTINGTSYRGSIRQANPATGAYTWQTGLPCAVEGTPSLDSAGVLAAGTYTFGTCPTGAYLIDAATGAILTTLPVGSARVFAQPVFAQQTLFVATETNGLYNFAPGP